MGDKILARQMAQNLGIPVIVGSTLMGDHIDAGEAEKLGYPILLKATAGGGGKGMKIVRRREDLGILFEEAGAEAHAAFGDSRLYLERFIPKARHVEIQILGDRFGRVVHLGERDCSLQRRYQKMVEETPSPALSPGLRKEICRAALVLAREIRYENAGTVEFLLEPEANRFSFLEMNTRIQVEHPVTEMVTGIDLVVEQIRIAAGEPLRFTQEAIRNRGHAIECRINAESPLRDFRPCPGRIKEWKPPRVSSSVWTLIVTAVISSLPIMIPSSGNSWLGRGPREAIGRMGKAWGISRFPGWIPPSLFTVSFWRAPTLQTGGFIPTGSKKHC